MAGAPSGKEKSAGGEQSGIEDGPENAGVCMRGCAQDFAEVVAGDAGFFAGERNPAGVLSFMCRENFRFGSHVKARGGLTWEILFKGEATSGESGKRNVVDVDDFGGGDAVERAGCLLSGEVVV